MTVEVVNFINDLNPASPTGADSISEGDDHIRIIKQAIKDTFPNVTEAINSTAAEIDEAVAGYATKKSGVFASCRYNGTSLMYEDNIGSVTEIEPGKTRVVFTAPTSGFDHQFAIMLQPYATGNKNLVMTVTDQRSDYFDFSTVEFDGTDWSIPASQAGFGLVIFDMVETNDGL